MYDVEPFVKPVPFNFERAVEIPNVEQELMAFRRDRSASPIGDMMRNVLEGKLRHAGMLGRETARTAT